LFILRLQNYKLDSEEVLKFLKFPFEIARNVQNDLIEKIRFNQQNRNSKREESILRENDIIYKIPFENALNLIAGMEYFLYKGFIYVFKYDLIKLIETVFRESIIKRMNVLTKYYEYINSDRRISDIIKRIILRREGNFKLISYINFSIENKI